MAFSKWRLGYAAVRGMGKKAEVLLLQERLMVLDGIERFRSSGQARLIWHDM